MAFNEDPATISFSDSKLILTSVSKNKIGRDIVTDLVFGKWNIIAEKYSGDHFFARTLQKLFSDRNTQQFLNKVFTMYCLQMLFSFMMYIVPFIIFTFFLFQLESFYEKNEETLTSANREVVQAIEKTKTNIKWMDSKYLTISAWLNEVSTIN